MNQNLQELTEKIYKEGVGKAEAQSAEILGQAKKEAREIIDAAERKAASIIEQAERDANDLKVKNESEMKLASRQALGTLKQQITDLLILEVLSEPVANAFDDDAFVKKIIEKLVDFWAANYGEEERMSILLPEKDFAEVQNYFSDRLQSKLKKGILLRPSGQMKSGFQISPENGSFKVRIII